MSVKPRGRATSRRARYIQLALSLKPGSDDVRTRLRDAGLRLREAASAAFPPGRAAEIAAYALELFLAEATAQQVEVGFDARLRELATGASRQVDVAVGYRLSRRFFLRIMEVKDTGRKVGPQLIDAVAGKALAVGAHRATIISTAGFTPAAVARIRAQSDDLDGGYLRPAIEDDWPVDWAPHVVLPSGDGVAVFELSSRVYHDVASDSPQLLILYGEIATPSVRGLATFLLPPAQLIPPEHDLIVVPRLIIEAAAPGFGGVEIALRLKSKDGGPNFIMRSG